MTFKVREWVLEQIREMGYEGQHTKFKEAVRGPGAPLNLATEAGIEIIPEGITEDVEGENGDHDDCACKC